MEKSIPCQHQSKESWTSYTNFKQSQFHNKGNYANKKEFYIMRKCQFSKITILTVFMCLITASKDVRQKLIEFQRRTVKSTTITGDTSKPASVSCRQSRWKTTKDTVKLNSTINQLDFIDIYRILHPVSAVYTLF